MEPILIESGKANVNITEPNELRAAYQQVLEEYVGHDGKIRYKELAADEKAQAKLDNFLTWVGQVEDRKLDESPARQEVKQAFYINAYNACVLRGVLEFYPFKKLSEPGVDFYEDLRFLAAGEILSLMQIAQRCENCDWRAAFALAGPSQSDPPMRKVLYTAEELQEQLDEAVKNYIGSCAGLRIDHAKRRVLLGKLLYERKGFFIQSYRDRYNIEKVSMISALVPWSWPRTQELLADMVGYKAAQQKWDARLNDAAEDEDEDVEDIDKLPCGIK